MRTSIFSGRCFRTPAARRLDAAWRRSARRAVWLAALLACTAGPASAQGWPMFDYSGDSSGEKPQSKLFYHDDTYWAVLRGPVGVAIYEKVGNEWLRGVFMDAVLASSGFADVKWDGSILHVLLCSNSPKYYEYTYDPALRAWNLSSGFPVSLSKPSGSETMVLEVDSAGRAWMACEAGYKINLYWSTSADRRTWTKTPLVLQSGVSSDDIASIVAFGGDRIGVFWSDQMRDEFGFRVHRDGDDPTVWAAGESIYPGVGHADDHINLTADSQGRVFAVTKDDFDRMAVHRRDVDGDWTTSEDVLDGTGTRGIIQLGELDARLYVLYTRWGVSPNPISFCSADPDELDFSPAEDLMVASRSLNNVTGTKQRLQPACLVAAAEGNGHLWWGGWGAPLASPTPPPGAPSGLTAELWAEPDRVELAWSAPGGGDEGYFVYRAVDGGAFQRLTPRALAATCFTDSLPSEGDLCYRVSAYAEAQEGPASDPACVRFAPPPPPPPPPPSAPQAVTATIGQALVGGASSGVAAYRLDEGVGQTLEDATGLGHTGQLGSTSGTDTSDPTWTAGVDGATALRFDGSNDRAIIPDAADLRFAGSMTLEAWIQLGKLGTAKCIVSKGDSGRRNYWLALDSSNRLELRWQSSGPRDHTVTSPTGIADLAWHHVACVLDFAAGECRMYVDGIRVHSDPATATPLTGSAPVYLGARLLAGTPKDFFNGAMDLVRLTPEAIYTADFTPPLGFGAGETRPVVQLAWEPPAVGTPVGYEIYRSIDGGPSEKLTAALVGTTSWIDLAPGPGTLCYSVTAVDAAAQTSPPSEPACISLEAAAKASFEPAEAGAPRAVRLGAGPNPFNPTTTLHFDLPQAADVHVSIYDVRGQRIVTLLDAPQPAGRHRIAWMGRDAHGRTAAAGVYFAVLRAGSVQRRVKLLLVK